MKGIDLSKHFSLTSANDVSQICSPLNDIGITYFNYIKIYNDDGSRELLTSNPYWIEHFYRRSFYLNAAAVDVEHLMPKGFFLWSELNKKDAIYLEGKEQFNIDNGISFVIKRSQFTYLYIFASTRNNDEINGFYLKNIDLLQRFIHYFNEKAIVLKRLASENRIFLPEMQLSPNKVVPKLDLNNELRRNFLKRTQTKKYYLLNISDNIYLTRKEKECANYFIKGFSAKAIANELDISFRTVEAYLGNIKNKISDELNMNLSREALIDILRKENLK